MRDDRLPVVILGLLVAVMVAIIAFDEARADPVSPAEHPATATVETLSPIARTDGWCFATSTTAADAWNSAPARVTTVIKSLVRAVEVIHSDDTNATIDICAKFGPTGSSDGLTCATDSGTAGKMSNVGESVRWTIARDLEGAGIVTPIWVRAASGTPSVCVGIAW